MAKPGRVRALPAFATLVLAVQWRFLYLQRSQRVADAPWYQDGLRFTCTQCGDCCGGAPGFVWVIDSEIAAIAKELGLDRETFEAQFVRREGMRKSLREFSNGDCVLLDKTTRKCTVYDSRPRQCKTWPFWGSNLKTPEDWEYTCQVCPGSGKGKLHSLQQIEDQRKVVKV